MTGSVTESRPHFELPDGGSEQGVYNSGQQAAEEDSASLGHQEMQNTSAQPCTVIQLCSSCYLAELSALQVSMDLMKGPQDR